MAAFGDLGAACGEPSCGRQDFLPFSCDACAGTFCSEHFRHAAHGCQAAAAKALDRQVVLCPRCREPVRVAAAGPGGDPLAGHACREAGQAAPAARRCAASGCREVLAAHNTVRCWRCSQDVCIRHRFEEDHACISVEAAVSKALGQVRASMARDEFAEAHKTLQKIFGNIIGDPGNEKFRMLKKSNAVVSQKLRHPACVEALKLCGFTDTSEAFVCRPTADLTLMTQMAAALKAHPPPEVSSTAASGGGGGTRLVNGVIIRAPAEEAPAAAAPPRAPAAAAPGHARVAAAAAAAGGAGAGGGGGACAPKPRTARDFERRGDREQHEKAQENSLQELRRLQKTRFQEASGGGGAGSGGSSAAGAGDAGSRAAEGSGSRGGGGGGGGGSGQDQCVLQ